MVSMLSRTLFALTATITLTNVPAFADQARWDRTHHNTLNTGPKDWHTLSTVYPHLSTIASPSPDTDDALEQHQDLVESAIQCENILRPLWGELLLIAQHPDFQRRFMASDAGQIWTQKVLAAQAQEFPEHLTVQQQFSQSQCARDFTIIGVKTPGFFLPTEMLIAARAFRAQPSEDGLMMAQQIQDWLAWASTLQRDNPT